MSEEEGSVFFFLYGKKLFELNCIEGIHPGEVVAVNINNLAYRQLEPRG